MSFSLSVLVGSVTVRLGFPEGLAAELEAVCVVDDAVEDGVGKKDRPIVIAALRTAFDQDRLEASKEHRAKLIDAFAPRHEKLAELMRRAEDDVLA